MFLNTYLDSVIDRYFSDFPAYINLEKFYIHQRTNLLEFLKGEKARGSSRENMWLGPLFLVPFVSCVVNIMDPEIFDYLSNGNNEEFFITIPDDIWNQL